jgi:hypothetical protein
MTCVGVIPQPGKAEHHRHHRGQDQDSFSSHEEPFHTRVLGDNETTLVRCVWFRLRRAQHLASLVGVSVLASRVPDRRRRCGRQSHCTAQMVALQSIENFVARTKSVAVEWPRYSVDTNAPTVNANQSRQKTDAQCVHSQRRKVYREAASRWARRSRLAQPADDRKRKRSPHQSSRLGGKICLVGWAGRCRRAA